MGVTVHLASVVMAIHAKVLAQLHVIFIDVALDDKSLLFTLSCISDVDECKEGLACQCDGCSCKNTWGGFDCKCKGNDLYIRGEDTCFGEEHIFTNSAYFSGLNSVSHLIYR